MRDRRWQDPDRADAWLLAAAVIAFVAIGWLVIVWLAPWT